MTHKIIGNFHVIHILSLLLFCYLSNSFVYVLFQEIPILSRFQSLPMPRYCVKVTAKKGKKAVKKTLTFKATVKNPTLTLKAAATELAVGETTTLTAKAAPKKTVSFKSSDETIATVDATGAVKAVKAGTVKITATAGKLSKDVELTVKKVILKSATQTEFNKIEAVIVGLCSPCAG